MRKFRKINKGFILTVIVVGILVIYLVQLEIQRNKEKPEIQKMCESYIDYVNKYNNSTNSNTNYDDLEKTIKSELNDYIINNEYAKTSEAQNIVSYSELCSDNKVQIKSRNVNKVKKYVFDGNQVAVTLKTTLEIEKTNTDGSIDKTSNDFEDIITLMKENGRWKICNSELTYPNEISSSVDYIQEDFIY